MSETDPINFSRHRSRQGTGGGEQGRDSRGEPQIVAFDRRELSQILRIYGFQVASGEWRDYAIDMLKDKAVFSVFRHASDVPLYRIEKDPKLARRQGAYSVITASGHIVRRGRDLDKVLRVLEPKPKLAMV